MVSPLRISFNLNRNPLYPRVLPGQPTRGPVLAIMVPDRSVKFPVRPCREILPKGPKMLALSAASRPLHQLDLGKFPVFSR